MKKEGVGVICSESEFFQWGMHDEDLISWAISEEYVLKLDKERGREHGKKIGYLLAEGKIWFQFVEYNSVLVLFWSAINFLFL